MTNTILTHKHILISLNEQSLKLDPNFQQELAYLKLNFCGRVYTTLNNSTFSDKRNFYVCGDITDIKIPQGPNIFVIKELSYGYDNLNSISLGEVPINIHNVGVYFRKLFPDNINHFEAIKNSHEFQTLTAGNRVGHAFRKGIYLTEIKSTSDDISFNLLRCSSDLSGPTDNFRQIDHQVIDKVNDVIGSVFKVPVKLNHVLAQIYENLIKTQGQKKVERKAVIKPHSDKTKDMPPNALIAFTTFYDNIQTQQKPNFDICHKNISVLSYLHFRLKDTVKDPNLVKEFSITLYPNSVFVIPLSTNRLYTHEIRVSMLPISKIPTRLGYVIRCSNTKAIFKDGQTFIDNDGSLIKLADSTVEDEKKLRELYLIENKTTDIVNYSDIYFSMNSGDYKRPIV